jgi:hypothetical protein
MSTPVPQDGVPAQKVSVQPLAPASVSRARRGIKVTVENAPTSRLVTVTLTLRGQLVARAAKRAGANGVVTLTLRPKRARAARLHAGVQLRLTVTVAGVKVVRTIRLRAARA